MQDMIRTEQIVYEYKLRDEEGNVIGTKPAVNGVSLSVKQGDFIAILGHNGSGKSTFAKHLNGLLVPNSGTVWVDGMDTGNQEMIWEIRQDVGMVFQNPDNQIIGSVVEEDVGFGPENIGIPTEQIWGRVEEGLQAVDMMKYRKHSPNKLSGGQKQRVAIAGILAMHPRCIVLDEPTAMLDPVGRREVVETAHKLNKEENMTVILITHYMDEVVDADYVYVMDHGKVFLKGTPREVFSQVETLLDYGLDIPQVTRIAWELEKLGYEIPRGLLTIRELASAIEEISNRR